MTKVPRARVLGWLLVCVLAGAGCEGDGDVSPSGLGPFRLTFSLDASFQGLHGGQPIAIALLRASDGAVVASGMGTISPTLDPSFRFSTGAVMQAGVDYEVHYWIDSNIGGGVAGACDPKAIDHQWSAEFLSVSNDIAFTTSHNPALTEDVCSTFG